MFQLLITLNMSTKVRLLWLLIGILESYPVALKVLLM